MPTITFATPPGRQSLFQISREAATDNSTANMDLIDIPLSPKSQIPTDLADLEQAAPLAFPKRCLQHPSVTTHHASTDVQTSLDTAAHTVETVPHRSLLSNALASGSSRTPPPESRRGQSILRRTSNVSMPLGHTPRNCRDADELISDDRKTHPGEGIRQNLGVKVELDSTTIPLTTDLPPDAIRAPKKRSLVIQEHADVIERAAERAARHFSKMDSSKSNETHSSRPRLLSMSSAGEETTSTVSTQSRRSSSRTSSIPTSPSLAYVQTDKFESGTGTASLAAWSQQIPVAPQGSLGCSAGQFDASPTSRRMSASGSSYEQVLQSPRKFQQQRSLTWSSDAVDHSRQAASVQQPFNDHIPGDQDREKVSASSHRALSFSHCPRPDRTSDVNVSPTFARRQKKLSASPAPQTLSYQQRLKGIRGLQPIRSPAPREKATLHSIERNIGKHSEEGSGYSEDEENSSDDDEDNDSDSLAAQDFEGGPDSDSHQGSISSLPIPGTQNRYSSSTTDSGAVLPSAGPANHPSRLATAHYTMADTQSNRSEDHEVSLSHPMCFLPDTFEDSRPATASEQESDAISPSFPNLSTFADSTSASASRRPSWQHVMLEPQPSLTEYGGTTEPIALPPFCRGRRSVHGLGMLSEGEQNLSLSASFGRNLRGLPSSMPRSAFNGLPGVDKSSSGHSSKPLPKLESARSSLRRASHSVGPKRARTALSSPIGSLSPGLALSSQFVDLRSTRPGMKQRAISVAGSSRSLASVAPCSRDTASGATSPPSENAFSLLKSYLASSPLTGASGSRSPGSGSEAVTPGWSSDGQPSLGTSRYWTERLSSLAQAMTGEISQVSSAVMGYDAKPSSAASPGVGAVHQRQRHERADSVPCERFADLDIANTAAPDAAQSRRPSAPVTNKVQIQIQDRPKPIRISTGCDKTSTSPSGHRARPRRQMTAPSKTSCAASSDTTDTDADASPSASRYRFHRQEVGGHDGHTHLIIVRDPAP